LSKGKHLYNRDICDFSNKKGVLQPNPTSFLYKIVTIC